MDNVYDKNIRISLGKDFSKFMPVTVKFSEIPNIVCSPNVLYSPTQYANNERKAANFLGFTDILIFDFDEGWTKEKDDFFNNFIGYKVPTKSHMKEKNGLVCERYRIILLLDKSINLNYREYKRLYKHIIKDLKLESDTSCVDACRFYYSSEQPINNCIKFEGTQYFNWEKYNYPDLKFAKLINEENEIDTSAFEGLDLSYLSNLNPSKRYPCPICRLEGFDQKGHHLGFNKDENYPTCFFDEDHSKILRRLYNKYKYSNTKNKIEEISNMVREKCTPDLIKLGQRNPKPTNYNSDLLTLYDKSLDVIEQDAIVDLDIETFYDYFVDETLEECEARLGKDYKYIKGAYNKKCEEFKNLALDPLLNKIRIITLSGNGAVCPFDMYYVKDIQKQRILNIIKNKLIVGHNLKFDLRSIMNKYGEDICPQYCFDTMLASRMIHMALDPEDQVIGHNLEATAFRFINFKMDKHIEHSWGNDNLTPEQLKYCGMDVKVLRPIFKEQCKQFMQIYGKFDSTHYDMSEIEYLGPLVQTHPVLALEMQTMLEMARLENSGVLSNSKMMLKQIDYYTELIDRYDNDLGINIGSSKQCVPLLQKYVDPKIDSSSKETLASYKDNPIVAKIMEGKQARTRKGLMESMAITNVHPFDGRIHASFNQLLSTNRFACKNPNMQQIPRTIKNEVYMSGPATIVYDDDYAAVELRLVTVVSGDKVLLEAYKNNTDLHYLTSSLLLDKKIPHTVEEKEDAEKNPNSQFVSKEERGFGKSCNFGLVYGISKEGFIALLRQNGSTMTDQELGKYYDKYYSSYPGVKAMIDNARKTFMYGTDKTIDRWVELKNGHLQKVTKEVPFYTHCRTLFGRVLTVDTQNKLMNYPVQGSGADTIKLAITKLGYESRKIKSTHRTINLIHDDTVGECIVTDFDTVSPIFRGALEWAVNYVLRHAFFTSVDKDFCILSMFGEEVMIEGALTLKDAQEKLIEMMKHNYEKFVKAKEANETEELVKLSEKLNTQNRVLEKLTKVINSKVA